jgi:hypothetical protein
MLDLCLVHFDIIKKIHLHTEIKSMEKSLKNKKSNNLNTNKDYKKAIKPASITL